MSNLRSQLIDAILRQGERSPQNLPAFMRQFIRRITGGEVAGAQLVRGLAWKYRTFVLLSLVANILAAVFEGGTMTIFTAALEYVGGEGQILDNLGILSPFIELAKQHIGESGIFLTLVSLAVLMQFGRSWFDYFGHVATAYLRTWSEGDVRRRLFTQFTSLSYASVSKHKVGDLASYMGEVERIGRFTAFANMLIGHTTIVIAYALVLFWLSWQMTLISVVGLLFLSTALSLVRRKVRFRSQEFVDAYVSINSNIVEYLSGMRLLHVFNRQQFAREHIEAPINDSIRARRRAIILSSSVPAIVQSLTILGVALFLGGGYYWIERTGETAYIPRLITFVFVIYRMLPRVTGINSMLAHISEELPFAHRIAEQLYGKGQHYQQMGVQSFTGLQRSIEFSDVSLRYDDTHREAVDQLSLTIERGEMVAFVGVSGSGKSSLVSLLLRLYDPTSGKILVDGVQLETIKREDWLSRIGVVDQDTFVFHQTIGHNIRFGRLEATQIDVIKAAKVANAHEFIMGLDNGYETVIGDRGVRLSGGQRQRLAIARAVVRDPDIMIFDEATSALDSHSEQLIRDAIEQLRPDKTILVIAHRLSTIAHADKIVVLHEGKIVETGTHIELLARQSRYRSMWQLQTGTIEERVVTP